MKLQGQIRSIEVIFEKLQFSPKIHIFDEHDDTFPNF